MIGKIVACLWCAYLIGGFAYVIATNDWGDSGSSAPKGFCTTHKCIPSFDESTGVHTQCADSEWSSSTGSGSCSYHGGEGQDSLPQIGVRIP